MHGATHQAVANGIALTAGVSHQSTGMRTRHFGPSHHANSLDVGAFDVAEGSYPRLTRDYLERETTHVTIAIECTTERGCLAAQHVTGLHITLQPDKLSFVRLSGINIVAQQVPIQVGLYEEGVVHCARSFQRVVRVIDHSTKLVVAVLVYRHAVLVVAVLLHQLATLGRAFYIVVFQHRIHLELHRLSLAGINSLGSRDSIAVLKISDTTGGIFAAVFAKVNRDVVICDCGDKPHTVALRPAVQFVGIMVAPRTDNLGCSLRLILVYQVEELKAAVRAHLHAIFDGHGGGTLAPADDSANRALVGGLASHLAVEKTALDNVGGTSTVSNDAAAVRPVTVGLACCYTG